MHHRKGFIPILAWVIVASGFTLSFFGKSAFSSLCGLPVIRGFQSCQPTIYDWVSMLAPYALILIVLGLLMMPPVFRLVRAYVLKH